MINKIYKSVLITGASSGIGLETLKRFFKGPVNLLDTSRNYGMGESELRIGRAIKNNSGWPNNFILSTKLDRDMNTLGFDKDRARKSLEESLNNLGSSNKHFEIFKRTISRMFEMTKSP